MGERSSRGERIGREPDVRQDRPEAGIEPDGVEFRIAAKPGGIHEDIQIRLVEHGDSGRSGARGGHHPGPVGGRPARARGEPGRSDGIGLATPASPRRAYGQFRPSKVSSALHHN